jgi:hypothetical protein
VGRSWPASPAILQLLRALRPRPGKVRDALAAVGWLRDGFGWPERPHRHRAWPLLVATSSTSSAAPLPPPSIGVEAAVAGRPISRVDRDPGWLA